MSRSTSDRLTREAVGSGNGAVILFLGTVRDDERRPRVTGIEYSAYEEMAERELLAIVDEAASAVRDRQWIVEHRLGELDVGRVCIAIAVAHPHRASRDGCAALHHRAAQARVPIWKLEHYTDGRASGSSRRQQDLPSSAS